MSFLGSSLANFFLSFSKEKERKKQRKKKEKLYSQARKVFQKLLFLKKKKKQKEEKLSSQARKAFRIHNQSNKRVDVLTKVNTSTLQPIVVVVIL